MAAAPLAAGEEAECVSVVVLAGGALERERFPGVGPEVASKAGLAVQGQELLFWTLRALRCCERIREVAVVADLRQPLRSPGIFQAIPVQETGSIGGNLRAGLDALPPSMRVLVVSGDLPLLTPAAVTDLLDHAPDADVVFPYVERADVEARFGGRAFLYARTADGQLTGCGAALIKPAAVRVRWDWVERLLGARRYSPLRLALLFGPLFALKLATRRLMVRDVEERFSRILQLTGRGYRTRYPELAMDVDKESDLTVVEAHLALRKGAAVKGEEGGRR